MRVAHENRPTVRLNPFFAHEPLRCVLGIHRWQWWLHEDVCVRCVRCYRRGETGDAPPHNGSVRAGGRVQPSLVRTPTCGPG